MATRGIFFVHVMKTGGISLSKLMRSWFEPADTYPEYGSAPVWQKTSLGPLLKSRDSEPAPRGFYTVHMPAWVADEVAPEHLRVTVLREPVARTLSHLRQIANIRPDLGSLEAIYDDPRWNVRLVNYQTRIFATTKHDYEEERHRRADLLDGGELTLDDLRGDAFLPLLTTGIDSSAPLGEDALATATGVLDRFDLVGVTEHIDRLAEQVAAAMGLEARPLEHLNRGPGSPRPAEALVERIRRDLALDTELYERARERALRGA